ncbi:ClC family H(+)/Cl(-) exchange transporter [Caldicellulosiruptor danielii]|uniref:ClC family H(+)/Cl(-) exchange transporter n=2 Tax=Anaerocellum danielii TaxID=1387557 RepID=A0ABZ0U3U3_9FIRM|nr:ClC family H(+)/Cl(-) exchange transporter [Caldicellulosiruptor danielii]WPX10159.1 ClC family H(+)/Cl(-) exchange transporter [Caldicellulosiruptor danielii]
MILEAFVVGIFAGAGVTLFRYILEKLSEVVKNIYVVLNTRHFWILGWAIVLIIVAYISGIILKKEPMISGSGIPQVSGIVRGLLKVDWFKILFCKFLGGVLCIGSGLSLGREGPSIQLGAAIGQGISRFLKRFRVEEKYLITCGASAGLSAAFNAPLAGVVFALEELHKNFSPLVLVSAMISSLTADFVSSSFFGLKPLFDFSYLTPIPLDNYPYLIMLGIIMGFMGFAFNMALLKTQGIYKKAKLKAEIKLLIPFLLSIFVGLFMPDALGGGENVIRSLNNSNYGLFFVLTLLVVKFLFTMVSYGSGAPGGIFMPLLLIGALVGNIYGICVSKFFHLNPRFIQDFAIIAMAGNFAAIVKAPITGALLVTEMTGSFRHLLALSTVSILAYLTSEILRNKPIYEALLERLLENGYAKVERDEENKILFEVPVGVGSAIDGKRIKDIEWPSDCLLVSIRRGSSELIPRGETKILAGDYLVVLTNENKILDLNEELSIMASQPTKLRDKKW